MKGRLIAVFAAVLVVIGIAGRRAPIITGVPASAQEITQSVYNLLGHGITDTVTPRVPNMVHIIARHKNGDVFYDRWVHNLRTNAGINWQYNQMAGTTAAVCNYIALTNTAITPAATDTALSGEISANGLARAQATPAHTTNATSYTLAYTWTCATSAQAAQAAGVFNAGSSGTLCFENTFTAASLQIGDTLQVTWTINF